MVAIAFISNAKADNNTFIDEHFIQDSTLVLASGFLASALAESICLYIPGLPPNRPNAFCQGFAPEAVAFFYLTKSKLSTDAMEVWSDLNMLLFGIGEALLPLVQDSPMCRVRIGVSAMFYYQAARSLANTATCHFSECRQPDLPTYVSLNGLATSLALLLLLPLRFQIEPYIFPGIVVIFLIHLSFEGFGKFIVLPLSLVSSVVGAVAALVMAALTELGIMASLAFVCLPGLVFALVTEVAFNIAFDVETNALAEITPVASAGIAAAATTIAGATGQTVAIAGAIAGVITRAFVFNPSVTIGTILFAAVDISLITAHFSILLISAGAIFEALAVSSAGAGAGAITGAIYEFLATPGIRVGPIFKVLATPGTGAGAGAGAVAGILIVAITGYIVSTMQQCYPAPALMRGLTLMVAAGLPLLTSSWLISLERFVRDNVTAHETMQNEFILPVP